MSNRDFRKFIYRIDENNIIVYVNEEWLEFARENKSAGLTRESVIGTSLWKYINDIETVHIYESLIERVKMNGNPVIVPYRCDSPQRRRFMEMKIYQIPANFIEFQNFILREEPRKLITLIDTAAPRNGKILELCGWCKKVLTPEGWVEIEEAMQLLKLFNIPKLPKISHGICPACKQNFSAQSTT